ncbi:MAG: Eco57I restriction-modification methylase domain-containing protein, partial [Myxococcota bacterium]
MHILARDIRSSVHMRQQPLFQQEDGSSLLAVRRGLVGVVLQVAFILYAEAAGALPLGHETYDRRFALTPLGAASNPRGAWERLLSLSEWLAGERRGPRSLPFPPWGSGVFGSAWLGAFAPRRSSEPLAPSDSAVRDAVRAMGWRGARPVDFESLEIEQIGGLYERLVGFDLLRCAGRSYRMGRSGVMIDLDALLALDPPRRAEQLASMGLKLGGPALARIEAASSFEALLSAVRGRRLAEPLPPGTIVLQPSCARRRAGAHYTPRRLACEVVGAALAPLLEEAEGQPERILALRVCDPAMGTGGFLVESCRQLADALVAAWQQTGSAQGEGSEDDVRRRARHWIASHCLYGVDLDPLAVDLARLCLRLAAMDADGSLPEVRQRLRCGDALLGIGAWEGNANATDPYLSGIGWIPKSRAALRAALRSRSGAGGRRTVRMDEARAYADRYVEQVVRVHAQGKSKRKLAKLGEELAKAPVLEAREPRSHAFHWPLEFPEVFAPRSGGFDAAVGNPPWVAFAGRAAQPLEKGTRGYYLHVSDAFRGYRTLQGLFVHRCASMLRPGGRLGLVVPTSMSDLAGYAPVRGVHDALCEVDGELPDFGEAFDGVFQPSMALLSTRREEAVRCNGEASAWLVRRDDLAGWARGVLERMARLPAMPAGAFAERGFQSTREDRPRIRSLSGPAAPYVRA